MPKDRAPSVSGYLLPARRRRSAVKQGHLTVKSADAGSFLVLGAYFSMLFAVWWDGGERSG